MLTTGGRRKYDTEYMRGVFFMIINSESLRKCCAWLPWDRKGERHLVRVCFRLQWYSHLIDREDYCTNCGEIKGFLFEFFSQPIGFVVGIGIFCSTILSFCPYVLLKRRVAYWEEAGACSLTCLYPDDKTFVSSSERKSVCSKNRESSRNMLFWG